MKIAGLDIGTTGCKCTVFDERGCLVDKAYCAYPAKRTASGHEIDVRAIMDAVYSSIGEMAKAYPDIAGIGVTSFGETFVCVDERGEPLHTAMLYTDPRGKEELELLVERMGAKKIADITGLRPHEMYSIAKIMWIKRHWPDVYAATKKICMMEDYVIYRLTGVAQIDYSLATRTMAFDIRELCWSREIFEAAEVDLRLMSSPVASGTETGKITSAAAIRTGLHPEVKVIAVGHDQVAAAVGSGAMDGSCAVDGAGTVECLTPIYEKLPDMEVMYKGHFAVVPYVVPGEYVAYGFSYTGGALMQWCTQTLAKKETESAVKTGLSVNEYLEREYIAQRGERPSGLLILPHFAGAATPYMDSGSKGAILGLTMDVTVADIYRGCMEGVVYEMYLNLQALRDSRLRFDRIRATGGGARSAQWMQMKADILNYPMTALRTADAGTVGSAMLTGIALGIFSNLKTAVSHMVEETAVYEPRPEMHERYEELFEKYKKVYQSVRPLM